MEKGHKNVFNVNTLLLLGCLGISYLNWKSNVDLSLKIDHIQSALYYRNNIDPEKPYKEKIPFNDSSKAPTHRDVMLAETTKPTVHKQN